MSARRDTVSGRTYLSIGDVLTLLRQEFPDVTISKIRFLESQGLVNPERTPSGYRKFYEQDVERLRWVLRQQREHFLPLKVIKGRLERRAPTPSTTTVTKPPAGDGAVRARSSPRRWGGRAPPRAPCARGRAARIRVLSPATPAAPSPPRGGVDVRTGSARRAPAPAPT